MLRTGESLDLGYLCSKYNKYDVYRIRAMQNRISYFYNLFCFWSLCIFFSILLFLFYRYRIFVEFVWWQNGTSNGNLALSTNISGIFKSPIWTQFYTWIRVGCVHASDSSAIRLNGLTSTYITYLWDNSFSWRLRWNILFEIVVFGNALTYNTTAYLKKKCGRCLVEIWFSNTLKNALISSFLYFTFSFYC